MHAYNTNDVNHPKEMILVILKSINQGSFVQKSTGSFFESERNDVHTT